MDATKREKFIDMAQGQRPLPNALMKLLVELSVDTAKEQKRIAARRPSEAG